MDIRFLTTFLEVTRTRHFGKAADNLYLTQSAVSARIKLVEEYFGTPLFIRNRNSIQLTSAGEKLIPYAQSLESKLAETRAALADEDMQYIACAATANANDLAMIEILFTAKNAFPDLCFRADILNVEQLSRQLHERVVHFALSTEPLKSDDFDNVLLTSIPLALYSSELQSPDPLLLDYVHIDWNSKISEAFIKRYPQAKKAKLRTSSYRIAIEHLAREGGSALLPLGTKLNDELLNQTQFVEDLSVNIYLVHMKDVKQKGLGEVIKFIRRKMAI